MWVASGGLASAAHPPAVWRSAGGCPRSSWPVPNTVSIKGGTYPALVDSGCNQTSVHQSLIQPESLDKSRVVRVRYMHGDMVNYSLVLVANTFRGQKHRVEVAQTSTDFGNQLARIFGIIGAVMCGYLLEQQRAGKGGGHAGKRG